MSKASDLGMCSSENQRIAVLEKKIAALEEALYRDSAVRKHRAKIMTVLKSISTSDLAEELLKRLSKSNGVLFECPRIFTELQDEIIKARAISLCED